MEKWVVTAKRADFNDIGRRFHIDPVIARCMRNRDIIGDEAIRVDGVVIGIAGLNLLAPATQMRLA